MEKYLLLIFSLWASVAFGQNDFKGNNFFLELGGNGVYGSFNYERQLTNQPSFSARIGIGTLYGQREIPTAQSAYWLTVPLGINYLINLKNYKSFIDAGNGLTWTPLELYFLLHSIQIEQAL